MGSNIMYLQNPSVGDKILFGTLFLDKIQDGWFKKI
jgi:hypothetical protein